MLVRRKNTTPTIVTSTSSAQKKRSDVKVNEPKGLVLNKRRLRDFKAIAYENADVEFLYLRQNEFTVFDPYINLSNLKVLDLSLNAITTAEFLTLLPNLRHLYLTGNNIERLEGFGNLPELETLCLSSNCISSFEGLQMLPSLRVLSLNYNNITSFKHFPHLPSLFALNLVGNPIADARCYRKMAVAVCPTLLSKVDGRVVENSERESIERYRGKVAYCVTEGLIVENEINLEQQSDTFLLESQRSRVGNRSLQLQSIFLSANGPEGIMREGVSISLHVCLQDMRPIDKRKNDIFHSKHLCPVAFKVSGTATEVFVVGSVNQWTEPIPLERCEENDGVFFQTTLYLPPSEYEYRYVVDGVEKISETNKTASKFKQGICNIYKVMEALPDDDSEHDTILHIRWLRHNRFNGFDIISDESGLTYTPTTDDVGHCLRAEVLIYIDGNFHTMFFDITPPIQPGHPTCTRLDIEGVPAEGNALRLTIDYTGGREGESEIHWFRVMPSGEEIALDVLNPREGYTPCLADVGHRLKVEYIPMRDDWVSGNPVVRYTAIVSAGVPVCKNIEIIGTGVQNDSLSLQYDYEGGVEGESKFQWFRINEEHDEFEPINGETSTTYIPTLNDVGKALAVEFTPVSREGIQGEANRLITDIPIAPAIPHITHISIQGTVQEQHRLSVEFDYVGGYQGSHHVQWYRRDGPSLVKIGKANSLNFTPSTREVGHVLEVSIVPVRSDGVRGQEARIATEKVEASPPQLVMFELSCENTRVGERVSVLAEYTGGEQGDSLVEWYRSEQDRPGEFKLVTSGIRLLTYLLTREDLGRHIRVVYTPVRKDGVRGEPKVRLTKVVEPM